MEPDSFTAAEPFGELWKIKKGSKVGLYDLATGTILVKPEYYDVKQPEVFANGSTLYLVASKPDKWGIINAEGTKLVKPKFSSISPLNSVNAALLYSGDEPKRVYFLADNKSHKVRSANKTIEKGGFYNWDIKYRTSWLDMEDSSLKFLQLPNGQIVDGDKSNLGSVNQFTTYSNKGNTTLFNKDGSVFMEVPGNVIDHEGWTITRNAAISPNSKVYKYHNFNGLIAVESAPNVFNPLASNGTIVNISITSAKPITNSLTAVSDENNKWGILRDDTLIRPFIDDCSAKKLSENYITTAKGGKEILLSKNGDVILEGDFDKFLYNQGMIITVKNNKRGLFNPAINKVLCEPEYDKIDLTDQYYKGIKGNKTQYFDYDGKKVDSTPRAHIDTWPEYNFNYYGTKVLKVNFELTVEFCEGMDIELRYDHYTSAGKLDNCKDMDGQSQTLHMDNVHFSKVGWFIRPHSLMRIPKGKKEQRYYLIFKLVDKKTGKAIPLSGKKKVEYVYYTYTIPLFN